MLLKNKWLFAIFCAVCCLFPSTAAAQSAALDGVRVNDFKVTLLSLGSGSTRVTYERAFSPRHSAEFTLGFVGLGWDWLNESDPQGLLAKVAFKWRLLPQRSSDSWLAGFYVKPELVCASFNYSERLSTALCSTVQTALMAECGYQLLAGWFVFDVYTGLGPSFGTGNGRNYYHSFVLFPKDGWLAFTAGFRLGVAF